MTRGLPVHDSLFSGTLTQVPCPTSILPYSFVNYGQTRLTLLAGVSAQQRLHNHVSFSTLVAQLVPCIIFEKRLCCRLEGFMFCCPSHNVIPLFFRRSFARKTKDI